MSHTSHTAQKERHERDTQGPLFFREPFLRVGLGAKSNQAHGRKDRERVPKGKPRGKRLVFHRMFLGSRMLVIGRRRGCFVGVDRRHDFFVGVRNLVSHGGASKVLYEVFVQNAFENQEV